MDQAFADRLARISASNAPIAVDPNVDVIGSSGRNKKAPLQDIYPNKEPLSYDQRFKMKIVHNFIGGLAWMGPTGYLAANFWGTAKFLAGAEATKESYFNTQVGLGVALAVSFALCYWVVREAIRDLGKLHGMPMSLAVGAVFGCLLGAGPVTAFKFAQEYGLFGL